MTKDQIEEESRYWADAQIDDVKERFSFDYDAEYAIAEAEMEDEGVTLLPRPTNMRPRSSRW